VMEQFVAILAQVISSRRFAGNSYLHPGRGITVHDLFPSGLGRFVR
jgi:hypothetical protein